MKNVRIFSTDQNVFEFFGVQECRGRCDALLVSAFRIKCFVADFYFAGQNVRSAVSLIPRPSRVRHQGKRPEN